MSDTALVTILVVSLLVLIPEQSTGALAAELIVGGVVNLLLAVRRQIRRLRAMPAAARREFLALVAVYNGSMLLIATGASPWPQASTLLSTSWLRQ